MQEYGSMLVHLQQHVDQDSQICVFFFIIMRTINEVTKEIILQTVSYTEEYFDGLTRWPCSVVCQHSVE